MKNLYIYIIILINTVLFSNEINFQRSISDSLPDNMPLVKKVFWGEKGILRDSFVDPQSRMKELRIRRNMLQWHQRFALFTLGTMMYQYNLGDKMVNDNYQLEYLRLQKDHKKLGYLTFGTYMSAASLSILSPPGMKYSKKKFSSNKIHRYLAIIHFAGMVAQPYLGYKTATCIDDPNCDETKVKNLHQTVGGITVTAYSLAFLSTLFK